MDGGGGGGVQWCAAAAALDATRPLVPVLLAGTGQYEAMANPPNRPTMRLLLAIPGFVVGTCRTNSKHGYGAACTGTS